MTTWAWRSHKFPAVHPFQVWLGGLLSLMAIGLVAGLVVMARGLVVTNLTDLVPWGLWITVDLSAIAMSAGAFSLSAAVYLLGLKRLAPLARTATFIGLIGYSMAVLCLLLDVGRPERFWHALVFWNPHSVLWEVTMCVTLYFTVLLIETAPIFGGLPWLARRWPGVARRLVGLHRLAPVLALAGLALSLLHQSSLGAAYGVLKARPIWYRPDLSILFMVSAIVGGQALTVLASLAAARLRPPLKLDEGALRQVTRFIGWALVGYLYLRFWDALSMTYTYLPGRTEGLRWLTTGPMAFNFWVIEMLLGAVVPAALLLVPRLQAWRPGRWLALALIVAGVVTYRWDTNLVGQLVILSYLPNELKGLLEDASAWEG
ncbi:MAG: NrfD/PsrC family molybdoenzyme membrane anchor subunit, partial [Anaerolineales bacterium]